MRIDEIHVYGFGQLRDVSYRFQDGLNVIEGLNEAGKTTLMAFIRGVLFGFESRRNPELRYAPADGGKFGGAIVLTDDEGQTVRVERIFRQKVAGDVTVQLPDGGEEGEAFLNRLLGNMNDKVFKNIFAFGLSELQQIDTLREDEINQFIYTAGTGDGETIRVVQKELTEKEQTLFRPHGSKAKINRKLQQIRQTRQDLIRLQQENEQFETLVAELDKLDREIEQEETLMESWRQAYTLQEKLLNQYDDYERYVSLLDRLEALPDISRFPENGLVRLDTLDKQIRDWKAQLADLEEQRDRVQEQLHATNDHASLLKLRLKIEDLRDKLSSFREHREQVERCRLNVRRERQRLTEVCERLGALWTEEKVANFDSSVSVKQAVRKFGTELDDLKSALSLAENERDKAHQYAEQCSAQLAEWQSREPVHPEKSKSSLVREEQALEQVKAIEHEQALLEHRITNLQEKIKDYKDTQATFSENATPSQTSVWKWVWLAITVIVPVGMWFFGQSSAAAIVFVVFAALTVRAFVKSTETNTLYTEMVDDVRKKTEAAENALRQLQADSERLRSEAETIRQQVDRSDDDIRMWETALQSDRESLRHWEQWKEQGAERARELEQARTVLTQAEQKWEDLNRTYSEKQDEWKQWLHARGLQGGESPELVLDMMREIEAAKEALRRVEEYDTEREKYEGYTAEYLKKLQSVLDLTETTVSSTDPEYQVRELSGLLEAAREEANHQKQLRKQLEEIRENIRAGKHRLQIEMEEKSRLLRQGGAEDEETFRRRSAQYQERKQLEQERELIERSLRRLGRELSDNPAALEYETDEHPVHGRASSGADPVEHLLRAMSRTSKSEIEDNCRSLQEKMTASRERLNQLRQDRADLSAKMDHLASGTVLSEQHQRLEQLVADLRQDAKEWAVIALGKHLLDRAMHIYEQEKQPSVLKRASRYVQQLTEGQYIRVLAPIGKESIEVERRDGRRFEPAFLSRGTVEQLYLAMRFALAEEYTRQALLPLVLDDIFVNFDPYRTRAAIRALAEIADTRQIFFFTCHTHICTLFKEENVLHTRIELETQVPLMQ